MHHLFRVELEDMSEYRKHNYKYVYAEDETDAIIQVLDGLDLKVSVKGGAQQVEKPDILDAAVEEAENRAPLRKLRRFL